MSLRHKTIAALALALTVLGVSAWMIQWQLVFPHFARLERQDATADAQRMEQALQRKLVSLDSFVRDYASWDDTYACLNGTKPTFIEENFTTITAVNFDVNLMALLGPHGDLRGGRLFPGEQRRRAPLPDLPLPGLAERLRQFHPAKDGDAVVGLCDSPWGPLLVVARPVLRTDRSGQSPGWLVAARFFDSSLQREFATVTAVAFSVQPVVAGSPPSTGAGQVQLSPDGKLLYVDKTENDLRGAPLLVLRSQTPRSITKAARTTLLLSSVSLLLLVFLGCLALFFLIDQLVLARVARMTNFMQRMGQAGVTPERLHATADDELGRLADELDKMLDRLDQAAQQRASAAEAEIIRVTAATYAHEINNPLAGIIGYLDQMRGQIIPPAEHDQIVLEMKQASVRIMDVLKKMEQLSRERLRELQHQAASDPSQQIRD